MAKAKTDVEKRNTALVAKLDAAVEEMTARSDDFDVDKMLMDIMAAETLDDALGSDVVHLADIIGVPFTVNSVDLQKSTMDTSLIPNYAVIHATLEDGSSVIITTGAVQIVGLLIKCHAEQWFPQKFVATATDTASGNTVYKLARP